MTAAATYVPDDTHIAAETLEFLHSGEGRDLREKVAGEESLTVAAVARLRGQFPAAAVHAALTLAALQPKARRKFADLGGEFIWALPEGLEQATDSAVARYKAARFAAANPSHIYDLCAGIGGDARALAEVAPTTAVDLSAARLACLRYNLEAQPPRHEVVTLVADVSSVLTGEAPGGLFHIDPARREGGRRSARWGDMIPGPEVVERVRKTFRGGAIKLSPAVSFDDLPGGHLELISHDRVVVQAVLWTGVLAAGFGGAGRGEDGGAMRTATVIANGVVATTYTGEVRAAEGDLEEELEGILYEVDGAFTRSGLAAGLAESLHLKVLTSDGGYLLGAAGGFLNFAAGDGKLPTHHPPTSHPLPSAFAAIPPSAPLVHPALTGFGILRAVRYSEKRVIEALGAMAGPGHEGGPVEVKTRGRIPGVDTDALQVRFSRASGRKLTVLIFRRGGEVVAVIARRLGVRL